ncbi:hypothetical protein DRO49_03390 [Candidatus Bathyarchaeota archaeon]|nr:MAG: hypothetical protein DRO49_03390 [Candidatus Bathyarchaeota archaeon]
MPGGVSSPVRAFKPFPFFTTHAKGSRIYDVDGREFIDFCLAYEPLVLGHCNDEVLDAVKEQLERGWLFGTIPQLQAYSRNSSKRDINLLVFLKESPKKYNRADSILILTSFLFLRKTFVALT